MMVLPDESEPGLPVHYGLRKRDLTSGSCASTSGRRAWCQPPPGTFGVEVDLGYQNTRAHQKIAHGNVERVLRM